MMNDKLGTQHTFNSIIISGWMVQEIEDYIFFSCPSMKSEKLMRDPDSTVKRSPH